MWQKMLQPGAGGGSTEKPLKVWSMYYETTNKSIDVSDVDTLYYSLYSTSGTSIKTNKGNALPIVAESTIAGATFFDTYLNGNTDLTSSIDVSEYTELLVTKARNVGLMLCNKPRVTW